MEIVPGPDFPTGGIILGRAGIRSAYVTGRGSIMMRGRVAVETVRKEREALVITEIPYQVNKATMIEKIAELVRDKRIEGISDIRDESDRHGMRVVIELKREAMADVVLNQLYRFSTLQTSFGANMVALNGGRPETMNLKDMLHAFVAFREEVVSRRTKFLLTKARDRAHVLVGLAIAVANIDEVIRIIRAAPDPNAAREQLMEPATGPAKDVAPLIALIDDPRHRIADDGTYRLSDAQARAILELRLARLTALGRDEIDEELNKLAAEISDYLDILRSRQRVRTIIKDELKAIRDEFATPRKTEIIEGGADLEDEDLIQREDMVVTVTHAGWIKRVPLDTYRAQRRGGKGRAGMATKEEDFVTRLFVANTHTPVLFFSSQGAGLQGEGLAAAAGRAAGARQGADQPAAALRRRAHHHHHAAARGRGELGDARRDVRHHRRHGPAQQAVRFRRRPPLRHDRHEARRRGGDPRRRDLHRARRRDPHHARGRCIRFAVPEVRVFAGRNSVGNRGIALDEGDAVISMAILRHFDATSDERGAYIKMSRAVRGEGEPEETSAEAEEETAGGELSQERYAEMSAAEQFILTLSENGYGKRTSSHEYRVTGRGGKGIVAMAVNERNGTLVASFPVDHGDQIMLVSDGGQIIRMPVDDIRIVGRGTQGVIVFKTAEDEKVVSVERLSEEDEPANDRLGRVIPETSEALSFFT